MAEWRNTRDGNTGIATPELVPFDLKLTYFANECSETSNSPNLMNLKKISSTWELELGKLYTLGDDLRLEDISNVIIVVAGEC